MAVPDWSDLHPDLLEQVAVKLIEIEDFTAFRGVCTSWRGALAATKDKFVCKIPLLLIPANGGGKLYSWRKRKIFSRMSLPEAEAKLPGFRAISAGFGWILTEAFSSGELSLVNPMSSSKIQLPNIVNFPGYQITYPNDTEFIANAVLSSNPSQTSDFVLMVVAGDLDLGFWRNGDNKWTKIDSKMHTYVLKICYYKHKLYAIGISGKLWIWDPYLNQTTESKLSHLRLLLMGKPDFLPPPKYLVESSKGELLLIIRDGLRFRTFQIDTVKGKDREIMSLDGDAIFMDRNSAVSVRAADFPGVVKANCIYFPVSSGTEMIIYNVERESVHREGLGVESIDSENILHREGPIWLR